MNVTGDHSPVRILVLIGTRPEAIKMLPVVLALRESTWFEPVVVTTGQHRDLVDPILELGAVEPDVDLGVGRPGLSLNDLVATVVTGLDEFYAFLIWPVLVRAAVRPLFRRGSWAKTSRNAIPGSGDTGAAA